MTSPTTTTTAPKAPPGPRHICPLTLREREALEMLALAATSETRFLGGDDIPNRNNAVLVEVAVELAAELDEVAATGSPCGDSIRLEDSEELRRALAVLEHASPMELVRFALRQKARALDGLFSRGRMAGLVGRRVAADMGQRWQYLAEGPGAEDQETRQSAAKCMQEGRAEAAECLFRAVADGSPLGVVVEAARALGEATPANRRVLEESQKTLLTAIDGQGQARRSVIGEAFMEGLGGVGRNILTGLVTTAASNEDLDQLLARDFAAEDRAKKEALASSTSPSDDDPGPAAPAAAKPRPAPFEGADDAQRALMVSCAMDAYTAAAFASGDPKVVTDAFIRAAGALVTLGLDSVEYRPGLTAWSSLAERARVAGLDVDTAEGAVAAVQRLCDPLVWKVASIDVRAA